MRETMKESDYSDDAEAEFLGRTVAETRTKREELARADDFLARYPNVGRLLPDGKTCALCGRATVKRAHGRYCRYDGTFAADWSNPSKTRAQKRSSKSWTRLRARYAKERKQRFEDASGHALAYPYPPTSAQDALRIVRARERLQNTVPLEETRSGDGLKATIYRGKFCIDVNVSMDAYPDSSYLGEYSADWSANAIDRFKAEAANGMRGTIYPDELEAEASRVARRDGTYRYFVPGECHLDADGGNRRAWNASGMSKHAADCLSRNMPSEALRRMDALNDGDWQYVNVDVRVSTIVKKPFSHPVECGSDSTGGVEYMPRMDGNDVFLAETVDECINNALADARKQLGED